MFRDLKVECKNCNHSNEEKVKVIYPETYSGTILRSFWCNGCGQPVIIRYQFTQDSVKIVKYLETSKVYAPRKPETGITIRPRQARPRQR